MTLPTGGVPREPFARPVRVEPKPSVTNGMHGVVDAVGAAFYMGPERECDFIAAAINAYTPPPAAPAPRETEMRVARSARRKRRSFTAQVMQMRTAGRKVSTRVLADRRRPS